MISVALVRRSIGTHMRRSARESCAQAVPAGAAPSLQGRQSGFKDPGTGSGRDGNGRSLHGVSTAVRRRFRRFRVCSFSGPQRASRSELQDRLAASTDTPEQRIRSERTRSEMELRQRKIKLETATTLVSPRVHGRNYWQIHPAARAPLPGLF